MEESGYVNYGEYSYKGYIWEEDGRKSIPALPKKRRRVDYRGAFSALLIFLCFIITMFSVNYITGEGLVELMTKLSDNQYITYYAVAADSYESSDLMSVNADELRLMGGAGYLIKDGKYYLVAAVYRNREDAEKILKGLSSPSACIYPIAFAKPSLRWCKKGDAVAVEAVLQYAQAIYDSLYSVSVRLDTGEISEFQAMAEIAVLKAETEALAQAFDDLGYDGGQTEAVKIKVELMSAIAILDGLSGGSLYGGYMVSDVRYAYTLILMGYKNLLNFV